MIDPVAYAKNLRANCLPARGFSVSYIAKEIERLAALAREEYGNTVPCLPADPTERFVARAKLVHGDRFDYSQAFYTTYKARVTIICQKHGAFEQTASNHLDGKGCAKCYGNTKKTTEDFIAEAKLKHGDRYDYSRVVYAGRSARVTVICQKHGAFEQFPSSHLSGAGCAKCAGRHRSTTEEFVAKARLAHGDRYDYSRVVYTMSKNRVTIICPDHGPFEQVAGSHLSGKGCDKCGGSTTKTTEEFIAKAMLKHGDRYDYSKAVYTLGRVKTTIICKKHGAFEQAPIDHLIGRGCPKCIGRNKTTKDFIAEAKLKHGDRYDYSRAIYAGATSKVTIICQKHGAFEQVADAHLHSGGCYKCGREKMWATRRASAAAKA